MKLNKLIITSKTGHCKNFLGSGSTGIACLSTKRKFIGIELQVDYYNLAVNRVKQYIKDYNMQDIKIKLA